MTPWEREAAIKRRRAATERIVREKPKSKRFEYGVITAAYGDGTYDVLVDGRTHPYARLEASDPQQVYFPGVRVVIGFHSNSQWLPFILSLERDRSAEFNVGAGSFMSGLWDQGQGFAHLGQRGYETGGLFTPFWGGGNAPSTLDSVAGANNEPPLGLIVIPLSGSTSAIVWLHSINTGGANYAYRLRAYLQSDLSTLWTSETFGTHTAVGAHGSEAPWGHLFWDGSRIVVIGRGDDLAETYWTFSATGSQQHTDALAYDLRNSSVAQGALVKGWHIHRDSEDGLIRGFLYDSNNGYQETWTIDPQTLLGEDYEVASTNLDTVGRWPVDTSRQRIYVWIAGWKVVGASAEDALIGSQSAGDPACGGGSTPRASCDAGGSVPTDYEGRSREHKGVLLSVAIQTGEVAWSHTTSLPATPILNSSSIADAEAALSVIHGDAFKGFASHQSRDLGDSPQDVAVGHVITFHPTGGIPTSTDLRGVEDAVYTSLNSRGVGWSGDCVTGGNTICGSFLVPDYEWYQPGSMHMLPLPGNGTEAPEQEFPTNWLDDLVGLIVPDPTTGHIYQVLVQQEIHVTGTTDTGNLIKQNAVSQLAVHQEFFPDEDGPHAGEVFVPDPFNQYYVDMDQVDLDTYNIGYDLYMQGVVGHHPKTVLRKFSPDGELLWTQDISQRFGGLGVLVNVYAIVPLPEVDRVLIVWDRHSTLDTGFDEGLEINKVDHYAYRAVDLYDSADGAHVQTYTMDEHDEEFLTEDEDENPLYVRKWDTFTNRPFVRGGKDSAGPYVCIFLMVTNRDTEVEYSRCWRFRFDSGATPTVTQTDSPITGFSDEIQGLSASMLAIAGDHAIWPRTETIGGVFRLVVQEI